MLLATITGSVIGSPGVKTREIDLSGRSQNQVPIGIPAGVVGTSTRGPAFVPVTVANFNQFLQKFGALEPHQFGPMALNEWLNNSRAGTFVRVLGTGDGKQKDATTGKVTNAGFVVGNELIQPSGDFGPNEYAGPTTTNPGVLGRTYFLGCFMSESNGSSFLSKAGRTMVVQWDGTTSYGSGSMPIIRGTVMAPSGVVLSLSSTVANNNTALSAHASNGVFGTGATNDGGATIGSVDITDSAYSFVMLLNGHKVNKTYGNVITASFNPISKNYFAKVFNTDPLRLEEAGHVLYSSWDVWPASAVPTGSLVQLSGSATVVGTSTLEEIAFLTTGSQARNTKVSTFPNYEGFENRFTTAKSPFVISQKFGGEAKPLFRVHALGDGAYSNDAFKITIKNIILPEPNSTDYPVFDLEVRKFDDSDRYPTVLEGFRKLDLNPISDRYIARIIGDKHAYFDFNRSAGAQKVITTGEHANTSNLIRVEMHANVSDGPGAIDRIAFPVGFKGIDYLVTSGTVLHSTGASDLTTPSSAVAGLGALHRAVVPPLPLRENVATGLANFKKADVRLNWGVQFERKDSLTQPNKNDVIDNSLYGFVKHFPSHDPDDPVVVGNSVAADNFNNNLFSLENVAVKTQSNGRPDPEEWHSASYARDAVLPSTLDKFVNPSDDFLDRTARKYAKFNFIVQGGFDGTNIFNKDRSRLNNAAIIREEANTATQGGAASGPTINAYRKALEIMEDKSLVEDIKLLAIPGIREPSVIDFAIQRVEDRFDALLLVDVQQVDKDNLLLTGSTLDRVDVGKSIDQFKSRITNVNSSFGAAYFPDLVLNDPRGLSGGVEVPPTVAVLGAFGLNDAVAHPWFAPAGFNRGALQNVIERKVNLNKSNLDDLYDARINPIFANATTSRPVVFGQKTMLTQQSSLDRVNVRRLLIEIRREIRLVSRNFLFAPNRGETLAAFNRAVQPVMNRIQQQQGLQNYKVLIDATTTTQADIENNVLRGQIFLQPTRSIEFISLDFVVTNAGEFV